MFVVGYYNKFTVVRTKIICKLILNTIESIVLLSHNQSTLNAHGIEHVINFQVHFII